MEHTEYSAEHTEYSAEHTTVDDTHTATMDTSEANTPLIPFAHVAKTAYADMFNHAMRLTYHNRARAQDIVQDSLIRAMNAWESFNPTGEFWPSVRGFMYRIVTNVFINEYQQRKRWHKVSQDSTREIVSTMHQHAHFAPADDGCFSAATPPEVELTAASTMSEEVAKAIADLPDWQRDVIVHHYVLGHSYKQISQDLGMPIGTVMSRLSRARSTLEVKLRVFARDELGYREGVVTSGSDVVDAGQHTSSGKAIKRPQADAHGVDAVM